MALARAMGVLDARRGDAWPRPSPPARTQLELVHDPALHRRGAAARRPDPAAFGLGTPDDPVFPGMHEASALVAGATLAAAARRCGPGTAEHGANIAGGLHHAMRRHASGFCVYNDPAIAIALAAGSRAPSGSPTSTSTCTTATASQAAFYDDPRVLTISLHEHPATLFPGTGLPGETGGPGAEGSAVNVALPAGHRRRRLAARVPRGRAAAAARVPAGDPGQPARLRHPPARPAGPPGADHRRPAGRARGHARAGARGRRAAAGC